MKDQNKPCIKQGPLQIKKGGVIMDVTTVEQAKVAGEGRRRRGNGSRTGPG